MSSSLVKYKILQFSPSELLFPINFNGFFLVSKGILFSKLNYRGEGLIGHVDYMDWVTLSY
jgi:hypothetical protein